MVIITQSFLTSSPTVALPLYTPCNTNKKAVVWQQQQKVIILVVAKRMRYVPKDERHTAKDYEEEDCEVTQ